MTSVKNDLTPMRAKKDKTTQEELRNNLKYMRDKDREMVRGKFNFHEVPGGSIGFNFKKYKEDDVEEFKMIDGHIYTIPRCVAEHLNKNGSYPIHSYAKSEDGSSVAKIGKKVHRFSFTSLEFTEDTDLLGNPTSLVTVENI